MIVKKRKSPRKLADDFVRRAKLERFSVAHDYAIFGFCRGYAASQRRNKTKLIQKRPHGRPRLLDTP